MTQPSKLKSLLAESKRASSVGKKVVSVSLKKKISGISKIKISDKRAKKNKLKLSEQRDSRKVELKIADNTETKLKTSIISRSKLQIASLSQFRFPIQNVKLLSSVARYTGVFFVIVGTFFSLVNLQFATGMIGDSSQQALLTDSTMTISGTNDTTTNTTVIMDPTPVAQFRILDTAPLHGIVTMEVVVERALEVKVQILRSGSSLGVYPTARVSGSVTDWFFNWNTIEFDNAADYSFTLHIKNESGSMYYQSISGLYEVKNATLEQVAPTSETNTTSSTTDTTYTSLNTTPTLTSLEAAPLSGDALFKILIKNATEVKVYAQNKVSTAIFYIGKAELRTGDEWRIVWRTSTVPDGNYELHAKATVNGTLVSSPQIHTSVDNVAEEVKEQTAIVADVVIAAAEPAPATLTPTIALKFSKTSPLSGFVDVYIETSSVDQVDLFATPKSSLTPFSLGLAQKISPTAWKYTWSTKQTPNGDYYVFARVKTQYGATDSLRREVRIANEVLGAFTATQENELDALYEADNRLIQTVYHADSVSSYAEEEYEPPKVVYVQPVDSFIDSIETEEEDMNEVETLLYDFRMRLETKMDDLARAQRYDDEDALMRINVEIEDLKNVILQELPAMTGKKDIINTINTYISQIIFELVELTIKNEIILKERIGGAIIKDSDKDGISDYDEINLYQTNPFAADTDGDSYIDSVEIEFGFNPHDSSSEALVTYESPKETGLVREDLLAVDSIASISPSETEGNGEATEGGRALISGKGLPSSFVTLYIYSTPIVVTVKTDTDGNWNYIFDKELENGNHEVYVAITSNTGRVVAKSNPLSFVKTAEAFTETNAVAAVMTAPSSDPSLFSSNMLLLVGSIAIVALGLVLLLLGIHVKDRRLIDSIAVPA